MDIIIFLVMGLIVGAVARFLIPGTDSMSWIATMLLGIVGSFVGGFLANLFNGGGFELTTVGFIGSVLGAIVALLVYRAATNSRLA